MNDEHGDTNARGFLTLRMEEISPNMDGTTYMLNKHFRPVDNGWYFRLWLGQCMAHILNET